MNNKGRGLEVGLVVVTLLIHTGFLGLMEGGI